MAALHSSSGVPPMGWRNGPLVWTVISRPALRKVRFWTSPHFCAKASSAVHRCRGAMPRFDRAQTSATTPEAPQDAAARTVRELALKLDGFAWESLAEEAAREGLTVEELVGYAVLYYLADADSGRVARQVSRSPYPQRAGTSS